jgi:hemerythrin superfamily protein
MSANTKSPPNANATDAIELLKADHKSVKALFQAFEKMKDRDDADDDKTELVQRICNELTVHTTIEEEIFYPALREALDDDDLIDEAEVEHGSAKDLIAELEAASPGDDQYDAKVTVLGELIDHHVKEEEGEMFPKAKKAIDAKALGAELAERKAELSNEAAASALNDPTKAPKAKPSRAGARRAS